MKQILKGSVYLAGPMSNIPEWNFPAFHATAKRLRDSGLEVINPAENFDGRTDLPWETYLSLAIKQVADCDEVAVLPGWEQSRGARLEVHVAKALSKPVFIAETMELWEPSVFPQEPVLDEAKRLVCEDRQNAYGPPTQDFTRTAAMWSAMKGVLFEPREVAMFMIALKLSRETHQNKRDNWVDIAGYAHCGHLCATA